MKEIGANSLSQTGQLSVETPTTNDYALTFTNGTHYTAALGRQPGTSGQMFVGGLSGTTLNLWAGGSLGILLILITLWSVGCMLFVGFGGWVIDYFFFDSTSGLLLGAVVYLFLTGLAFYLLG